MADESETGSPGSVAAGGEEPAKSTSKGGAFSLGRYLRQILDELRKVVRPTRNEWTTYTIVVIVFVVAVMAYVFGLDSLITRLVFWAFAGSGS